MVQERDIDPTALSDEDLALAFKEGNQVAFDELVRRNQGRVYAVAFRITGTREDALDVAQEVFLKAYQKIGSWQPVSGFVPWLLRLTTNQAIDLLRWRRRRPQERLDESVGHATASAAVEPTRMDTEERVRAAEIDARVQAALIVLSPAQRAVFAMRHYEGLQLQDIAEAMGCTVGSVKVHLFRAVKKLQIELKDLNT